MTVPVNVWLDDVDQQFQALACYVNTPDGQKSLIWRTLQKHTTFHQGLNTLASISNVANVNAIVALVEAVLRTVFTGMITNFEQYITSSGTIVQGWTQAWRICEAKWEIESLKQPEEQEPDEDDEDDWLPRYQIFTSPDASMAELQALEHALGGGGRLPYPTHQVFLARVLTRRLQAGRFPRPMQRTGSRDTSST